MFLVFSSIPRSVENETTVVDLISNPKVVKVYDPTGKVPLHQYGEKEDEDEPSHWVKDHLGISEERQRLVTKERDVHIITKSKKPKTVSNQTTEECVMSDDY